MNQEHIYLKWFMEVSNQEYKGNIKQFQKVILNQI